MLLHVPGYLTQPQADDMLAWALGRVQWRAEQIRLFGRDVMVPRLVSWFGEPGVCYRYSGVDHEAGGWPVALAVLRARLADDLGICSNFVLLNRYRSGLDSMGWHADDEAELVGPVVSVSLGATRLLHLRSTRQAPTAALALGHGALLMHQRSDYHALPKTRLPVGERISMTFRQVRNRER